MLHTINGIPAHVLLIHVVVVLIPLGALFTVLSAIWPAARHKLGFISPLTCLIALIFVPVTTSAGHWLQAQEHFTGALGARIQKHANLAHNFVLYALALFVVSAVVWWLGRRTEFSLRPAHGATEVGPATSTISGGTATAVRTRPQATRTLPQWASIAIAVVAIAVSAVVTWQLYRIGDAGAHAVWQGIVR
jgi:hypothetical protein